MRAAPIVEVQSKSKTDSQKGEYETRSVGFPTRVVSTFKRDVTMALNDKKKTLYLKFEILNKGNLIDSLSNGCRIMQLNGNLSQSGGIVIEDSIGRVELIPYAELREIFREKQTAPLQGPTNLNTAPTFNNQATSVFSSEHYLDLLILGYKNDMTTANFFADEIRIPHVVHFKFHDKDHDFRHKIYEDHCIDKFSQFFLENIVDGLTVRNSFERARIRTFDSLSETYFESRDNNYIQSIVGEGPILLPRDAPHDEVLYGSDDYKLSDGRIEDISHVRYPTNIGRTILPYTGRNNDIYAVMKLLVTLKFKFVKLTGDPGIGKTTFVLQTSYYLLTRNFFPDGIFYFPLKNIRNQALKDMMKDTFGPKFENNMKNFFRDKKMLLVFDDFDVFYQRGIEFPRLIFLTLRECGIATLVVTSPKRKQDFMAKKRWQHEYEVKQKTIEDEFLHTERVLKPIKDEEMAHILFSYIKMPKDLEVDIDKIIESRAVKMAEGNPRLLLQQLIEKKISINKTVLEIDPHYLDELQHDQVLADAMSGHSASSLKLGRKGSNLANETLKLSKFHRNNSTKQPHLSPSHSLQLAARSKSVSMQSLSFRESYGEKKDHNKILQSRMSSNLEHLLEKPFELSEEDEEKLNEVEHHERRSHSHKLKREKSHKGITSFKSEEKAMHHTHSIRHDPMYCYEEQKSNDAHEILQGMMSDDDEKDEIFRVDVSDENLEHFTKGASESDDEQGRFEDDEEEKGYFSHEEGIGRKNSYLEEDLIATDENERYRATGFSIVRRFSRNEVKGKKYSALNQNTNKFKYDEDRTKMDHRDTWSKEMMAKKPSKVTKIKRSYKRRVIGGSDGDDD